MTALRVEVLGRGAAAQQVAVELAAAGGPALDVRREPRAGEPPALVVEVSAGDGCVAQAAADVVVPSGSNPGTAALQLWRGRLQPWAAVLGGERFDAGPARLHDHDPEWPRLASRRLQRLGAALSGPHPDGADLDHIGSTAVPGLAAKAVVDLQVRLAELPSEAEVTALFAPLGYVLVPGSRPDSPGVHSDARMPADPPGAPDAAFAKRLLVAPDPLVPSVLHVRRRDSPFAAHVVAFRDWLRAHPEGRRRYEDVKRGLESAHAGDADHDDYTRGKSDLLRELAPVWTTWAAGRGRGEGGQQP